MTSMWNKTLAVGALVLGGLGCGGATGEIKDYSDTDTEFHAERLYGGITDSTAEATALLKVANSATVKELLDKAGLRDRAAYNIENFRQGDDEATGGSDDRTFKTLADLDSVQFVGDKEFKALLAYAVSLGYLGNTLSNSTAVALPDLSTNSSTIEATGSGTVDTLKVTFDLSHTYPSDLIITLSKDGKSATLSDRAKFNRPATFDVSATFKGVSAAGKWVLTIVDKASGDSGTLNGWSLALTTTGGNTGTGGTGGGSGSSSPWSCTGTPLSNGELAVLFPAGTSSIKLGGGPIDCRTRACTRLTGCGAWSTPAQGSYQRIYSDGRGFYGGTNSYKAEYIARLAAGTTAFSIDLSSDAMYGSGGHGIVGGQLPNTSRSWKTVSSWSAYVNDSSQSMGWTGEITKGCLAMRATLYGAPTDSSVASWSETECGFALSY